MSMATTVTVDPAQFEHAEAVLRDLESKLSPEGMVETWGAVSESLSEYYEREWPPADSKNLTLQDDTLARHPGEDPLTLDGKLHQSLSSKTHGNGAVRKITPESLRWGTSVYYGRFVNDGTVHMEPREFFRLTPEVRAVVTEVLHERTGVSDLLRLV